MKRIVLFIFSVFCLSAAANAQMAPDLDTLGNVWIVTIDDSGSMLNTSSSPWTSANQSPLSLARMVRDRMVGYDFYDKIDFDHDRFVFYRSGYTYNRARGLGYELASAPALDTSFIHHTDARLYRLSGRDELIRKVHDLIATGSYDHQLSFVSQIRTFSVVKTVNMLTKSGENLSFDTFRLLTITDDADQNDQWQVDYKVLATADRVTTPGKTPISQSVRQTIQKYVYNDLTGQGAGVFSPVFTDVSVMPHVWVYEYNTVSSVKDTLQVGVLNVKAHDGKSVIMRTRMRDFGRDSVCSYSVDSIVINGVRHDVDARFEKNYVASVSYKNALRFNKVKVYGEVQLKYHDEIYGEHYRKVAFVQEQLLPSGVLNAIFSILAAIAGTIILGYLLYRIIILPRRMLVRIYDTNGKIVTIRRGFMHNWRNDVEAIVHYDISRNSICKTLARKCRNVEVETAQISGTGKDVLLCSRTRLNISDTELEHTTFENIDAIYQLRQGHYPAILQDVYRKTFISKMYRFYDAASNAFVIWLTGHIISILQKCAPMHYYYYSDVSQYDSLCLEAPSLLNDRKFLIETGRESREVLTLEEQLANKALSIYYGDRTDYGYDALLCYDVFEGKEYWNIIRLDDPTSLWNGLKNVSVIYRFVKDIDAAGQPVNERLLLNYARRKMRRYSLGVLRCDGIQPEEYIRFNISFVPVPGFVSMVEAAEKPRSQLLYSPFADGFIKYKYVALKSNLMDGHLYLSFLPYKYVQPGTMLRRISAQVLRPGDMSSGKLLVEYDDVMYKGVGGKLNF